MDDFGETRSKARSKCAEDAVFFIKSKGLWCDLSNENIEPSEDNCINQLQELYQKGYIKEPTYFFEDDCKLWNCDCIFEAIKGYGKGTSKTQAKKKAAYMALIRFLQSCGRKDLKKFPGVRLNPLYFICLLEITLTQLYTHQYLNYHSMVYIYDTCTSRLFIPLFFSE